MPAAMKDWIKRHTQLTAEERLVVAGILLVLLVGIGVRACERNRDRSAPVKHAEAERAP